MGGAINQPYALPRCRLICTGLGHTCIAPSAFPKILGIMYSQRLHGHQLLAMVKVLAIYTASLQHVRRCNSPPDLAALPAPRIRWLRHSRACGRSRTAGGHCVLFWNKHNFWHTVSVLGISLLAAYIRSSHGPGVHPLAPILSNRLVQEPLPAPRPVRVDPAVLVRGQARVLQAPQDELLPPEQRHVRLAGHDLVKVVGQRRAIWNTS